MVHEYNIAGAAGAASAFVHDLCVCVCVVHGEWERDHLSNCVWVKKSERSPERTLQNTHCDFGRNLQIFAWQT